jgi:hypothetical protein
LARVARLLEIDTDRKSIPAPSLAPLSTNVGTQAPAQRSRSARSQPQQN